MQNYKIRRNTIKKTEHFSILRLFKLKKAGKLHSPSSPNLLTARKNLNTTLLATTLILAFLGIIFVADASAPSAIENFADKFYFARQQAVWGIVGLVIMLFFWKLNIKFLEKTATLIFVINIILLILVLIPGVGVKTLGARRWINLGYFSAQPTELMKLSMSIYFAKLFSKDKATLAYIIPLAIVLLLIMIQPDLGTALIIASIAFSQLFLSGVNIFHMLGLGAMGLIATLITIITSSYRRARLLTYLNHTTNIQGESYHIKQILLALGSGGLFGVGLGQSRQKFLFLPEAATDSIFAVIAEEVGYIGSLIVIAIFALLIFECIKVVKHAPTKFTYLLAFGITTWISAQFLLNISAMTALVPLTGIPMPFLSYGGSALTTLLASIGILLNISSNAKKS